MLQQRRQHSKKLVLAPIEPAILYSLRAPRCVAISAWLRLFQACALYFTLFFCTSPAFAGELKIVDQDGLIRLESVVHAPVTVAVRVAARKSVSKISLVNLDGLLPDQEGKSDPQGLVLFAAVPEGAWQIKSGEGQLRIESVQLK